VKSSPEYFYKIKVITATKEGKVVFFKIRNRTYYPIRSYFKTIPISLQKKKATKVSNPE
jgi:hypothetical protein